MKITNEMIERTYDISKVVYTGNISKKDARIKIADETGMNVGSAQGYIFDFLAMMSGEKYIRTMNV